MTAQGTKLFLNGQPFEVHGVEFIATAGPPDWLRSGGPNGSGYPNFFAAYQRFNTSGAASFDHARSYFGANLIEFKVSQTGFDVQDTTFTPAQHQAYIAEVQSATALARSKGFVVLLATLNTSISAKPQDQMNYPSEATERVDVALANMFKSDRGVIIELNNEPWPPQRGDNTDMWRTYIAGGPGKDGLPQVGIQQILNSVRSTGALNLVLVEPYFHFGFAGYPGGLTDPAHNMAFAIHTYFHQIGATPQEWDAYFGDFARTHPVVVTEWSQPSGPAKNKLPYDWCTGPETANTPRQFMAYLRSHGVNGISGWAYDLPGTLLETYDGEATTIKGCGAEDSNIGAWMKDYFAGGPH